MGKNDTGKSIEKFIMGFILGCFIITCIYVGAAKISEGKNQGGTEDGSPHFDTMEQGTIEGTYFQYIIIADRDTDVEYLIIRRGDNVSVTLMRDSGGMVLLRE